MKRVSVLLILLIIVWVPQVAAETMVGDPSETLSRRIMEYNNKTYRMKNRITTILLLGIDQWQDEQNNTQYRKGGQSDFLLLIVVDDNTQTVSMIQINRDTMAEISILNLLGQTIGTQICQICLAHAYGDGGEMSARLTMEALKKRLKNTPIDHFFAMNLDGIGAMNDFLGGIEVVLEDDFSVYDPEMTPGKVLRLSGKQAEIYLRNRYYIGDGSNALRMKRQKQYLEQVKEILVSNIKESPTYLLKAFDALVPYTTTDMNRGYIINLSNRCNQFDVLPVMEIAGISTIGENGYLEFYADETSLMETILQTFYEPL